MMTGLAKTIIVALLIVTVLPALIGSAQERSKETCPLPQSIKLDTFESLPLDEQRARLVKLIPVMEPLKNSHGFIVIYAGRLSTLAEAQRRADQAKRQLLEKHEWIKSDAVNPRVNTLVCGYREQATIELWVTPVGAAPPVCAPTVTKTETRPKPQSRARR